MRDDARDKPGIRFLTLTWNGARPAVWRRMLAAVSNPQEVAVKLPRLNRRQREALQVLLRHGRAFASLSAVTRARHSPCISYATARGLIDRGLATHDAPRPFTGMLCYPTALARQIEPHLAG